MQNYPGSYPGGEIAPAKTQVLGLDSNIAAVLAYLPICGINLITSILWVATEPKSNRLVRFHAFQSLILMVVGIVGSIGLWIVSFVATIVLASLSDVLGLVASLAIFAVMLVFGLGLLVMVILGMVKAYKGEVWKMPLIGNFAEKMA